MPSFGPTVAGNTRKQQRQLDKAGSAPLGPVSIGPGEGWIRMYTGSGDTFELLPEGARVKFRGAMTGLTPLMEQHQTAIDAFTGSLAAFGPRLDSIEANNVAQGNQINGALTRLDSAEGNILAQGGQINGALTRIGGVESKNVTQDNWITSHDTRLGNVEAKNSSQDSAISTAQARADSAHTRIDGLSYASPAQIAQLQDLIQNLQGRVQALEDWRASLPQG